jgi:acetylornithine deacetylase/succinyl-diaminopimelate desuccinylase-like protein
VRASERVADSEGSHFTSITRTTDARFYTSIHHNQEEVVDTSCDGSEATNIHGIDESVSLERV